MSPRLIKNSKLTNRQIYRLIDLFVLEMPAIKAAKIVGVNRHSVDRIYAFIRVKIAWECEKASLCSTNKKENEIDKSVLEKISKKHLQETPIIGISKLNDKIYTEVIDDITITKLKYIIRTKYVPHNIRKRKGFTAFDSLIYNGSKYYKINYHNMLQQKNIGIDEIKNFWGYTKTKLKKYYGINKKYLYLYFKEMEFRFNNRNNPDLSQEIRRIIKNN